jgi:hypothetical protein
MNIPTTFPEQLRQSLTNPGRGVLGLVDDLLAVSREYGIQLDWQAGQCRVRFRDGDPASEIVVPLRKSIFRAAMARIAVLCNLRKPNSVSPYGGKGQLTFGPEPSTALRVLFVNTPDEQSLELTSLGDEGFPATPKVGDEEMRSKVAHVSGRANGTDATRGINQITGP